MGTQPPLTSKIFLTEMESPEEGRGLYSPIFAHKFRTELTALATALLSKASVHNSFTTT